MYKCAPAAYDETVPGGHPIVRYVADSHPQWSGPADVTSSNGLTVPPSRVQLYPG